MKYKFTEEKIEENGVVKEISIMVYRFFKEIGMIRVKINPGYTYIESFSVHEKYRRRGVGRQLFENIVKRLKELDENTLEVSPKSYDLYSDKDIDIKDLYTIYIKLGFCFVNENPKTTGSGELMKYDIK